MKEANYRTVKTDPAQNIVRHKAKLREVLEVLTLLLCYVPIASVSAQETLGGGWSINSTSESLVVNMAIHLQPQKGASDNRYFRVALNEFDGLSREDLSSRNVAVKFRLKREAGTFSCEGTFKDGKGSGNFVFSPDQGFVSRMRQLGFDNLSTEDEFSIAVQNIGLARIQELKAQKGGNLSRSQFLHLIHYGVDTDDKKSFDSRQADRQTTEPQGRMVQAGMNSDFSRELESMGYTTLTPTQLNALRENGVTTAFIKQLDAMGYVHPSVEELVALRENGTTIKYIEEVKALGYPKPSIADLIALRQSGVSAAYIKELQTMGYGQSALDDIAKLRGAGISLDSIRKIQAMGYFLPSISELMSMQIQGVTTSYIREVEALGYQGLSIKQLICMRIQGLSVDFMKQTRASGKNLSVRELVKLRSSGRPIEGACGLETFPDDVPK